MMHFTPGPLCMFRSSFDVSTKEAQLSRCCGDAKHLWPQGQCHRGKRWQGAVLEGREAHLDAVSPGSAAAKARGLSLLQHSPCAPPQPLPDPQPQVRKVPFCLWCRGALNCLSMDPSADGAAPAAVLQKSPVAPFSWACAPQGGSCKVLLCPSTRGWGIKRTCWVYSLSWESGKEWNSISNYLFQHTIFTVLKNDLPVVCATPPRFKRLETFLLLYNALSP